MTATQTAPLGRHAIVIGAGIGGLAAAGALADFFERVTILERDALPADPSPRAGVPQSNHPHALLLGGQRALDDLFPGFEADLARAGAVTLRAVSDVREERPHFDPFPQRDIGWIGYTMSRPLLEHVARRRVEALPNVTLRDKCQVLAIMAAADGAVAGVRFAPKGSGEEALAADLVVDASGRGALTLAFLEASGRSQPAQTTIGIDVNYATTTFAIPEGQRDWTLVVTFPDVPGATNAACLMPIEGNRWMALVGAWHSTPAAADADAFMQSLRSLRTSTIFDAVRGAERLDVIHRFAFPDSSWRHFESVADFPRNLVPLGDAISRFNPIYGQGMAVAAQEARALKDLLGARRGDADPFAGFAPAYLAAVHPIIAATWSMSAVPDFIFPQTRGERPSDIENSLRFSAGLTMLAARDPEVHKLMLGVRHLIESPAALRDLALVQRVQMELAGASSARASTS
ncbi:MAG TPA: FAD-dependent monooxygenase [Alphaproteobacteria bacterium]|jgi:2-polyprenyl-6-methoxyphenol hydroxylase-like FAD-dependent oxidoreductase|nr:FAD-dependent monooxygenase [Alphaproteobacteria bacterium]